VSYGPASPVFRKSITSAAFAAFLRAKGSPAAAEASAIFAVLGAVDPAVALGQFGAESTFGRAGYAKITKNWGNIVISRPLLPHWTRAFGGSPWKAPNGRTYARFGTWRNGARAYVALLNTYRLRGWAPSVSAMCRKWLGGIGTGYIANIVRIANQAAGTVAPPAPPPVVIPPPVIPPISTTPTRIAAQQRDPFTPAAFWTAVWSLDGSAWIASGGAARPVCLLIHGGPIADDNLGGIDNLAGSLAVAGAKAIALRYPTLDTTLAAAMAPLRAAVALYKPTVIVAHSLGGYFGGILAAETGLPLVMVATDDRLALGGPVGRAALLASKVRVTVITGSLDPVATVAEHQALVADLAKSGHPGRWVVIDGANHDSILSDTGTIAAIQGG